MGRSSSVVDETVAVALNTTRLAPRNSTLLFSCCAAGDETEENASSKLDDDDEDILAALSDGGDILDDESVTLFYCKSKSNNEIIGLGFITKPNKMFRFPPNLYKKIFFYNN